MIMCELCESPPLHSDYVVIIYSYGPGACSLHPFTLRTLRTCTVFRLTISRLEAFLEGLQPGESADVRERLSGAMQMDRGMGHDR